MYSRELLRAINGSRQWLATAFIVLLTVMIAVLPAAAAQGLPAQNMCVECDLLQEQFRIVRDKGEVFDDGLRLLRRTRRDLDADRSVADGLAAAYTTLQGLIGVQRSSAWL